MEVLAFEDLVERRVGSTATVACVVLSPEVSLALTSLLAVVEDLVADRRESLAVAAFFAGGAESSVGADFRFCESTEEEDLAGRTGGRGRGSGGGRDLGRSAGLKVVVEVILAAARRIISSSARLRGVGATLTRPMMKRPIGEVADADAEDENWVE